MRADQPKMLNFLYRHLHLRDFKRPEEDNKCSIVVILIKDNNDNNKSDPKGGRNILDTVIALLQLFI